jgi:hypothetical protein
MIAGVDEQLRYRVLTGPDDRAFCEEVSAAMDEGYRLHGPPSVTFDGERVIVVQALVLDPWPDGAVPSGAQPFGAVQ